MRPWRTLAAGAASAFLLAACSQQPSQIVYKGHADFSRRSSDSALSTYEPSRFGTSYSSFSNSSPNENAPMPLENTDNTARVESVGMKDLAPPAKPANPQNVSSAGPKNDKAGHMLDDSLNNAAKEQQTPAATPAEEKMIQKASLTAQKPDAGRQIASSEGFIWPVNGKVISGFGPKGKGFVNDGINIAASGGEPVWAVADGRVAYAGNQLKGYGNMVLITHDGGVSTSYAHLGSMSVKKGQKVYQGDLIGYVGSTGNVSSPQLHFAVREDKKPVNPLNYLPRAVADRE